LQWRILQKLYEIQTFFPSSSSAGIIFVGSLFEWW
jgi:hypothetical protein